MRLSEIIDRRRPKIQFLICILMNSNQETTDPPPKSTKSTDPSLTTESVESPALALERVHYVHRSDCLAAGMLRVGDGVPDDVL